MIGLLAWIAKLGLGGLVERTLAYLERKADTELGQDKLRTEIAVEHIRAAVSETQIMADLNRTKLGTNLFWWFLAIFVVPLGIWWTAVIADSLFHFRWNVAALPEPLDAWAADMIRWLFYVGSGVGGAAALKGVLSR